MTRIVAAAAALIVAVACTHAVNDADQTTPQTAARTATPPSDAQAAASFDARLKDYVELHSKLEQSLPPLPKETNPTVIDRHQRALEKLLKEHRKDARRGDIFTPDGEQMIRRILGQVFKGSEGAKLKATIMDENPSTVKLAVNARYPDEVPLSTMPPQVLAMLPKLPDHLEYRFIGHRLILLDVHAHTVADYIENALP